MKSPVDRYKEKKSRVSKCSLPLSFKILLVFHLCTLSACLCILRAGAWMLGGLLQSCWDKQREQHGNWLCCIFPIRINSRYPFLQGGASGKEPTCQCQRHKRHRFDPWVGKIPWRRAWQPAPILAWRISWTGEFDGLQFIGPQIIKQLSMHTWWQNYFMILLKKKKNKRTPLLAV